MKKFSILTFSCSIFVLILMAGCTPTSSYVTTFTPEKKVPRQLDMSYVGPKANIAVGDFEAKARGSTLYIGDGLREMLETALFESMRFNVLDRMDTKGLIAEQKLSHSKLVRRGAKELGGQLEVAELLIYGAITEFEAEAIGGGVKADLPKTWDSASVKKATAKASGKNAHMAIDIRVVDTASGRLVAARRIAGSAASWKATVGANVEFQVAPDSVARKIQTPVSLGMFKNTPMELAIRDCIYRAVIYATSAVPPLYFRH